MPLELLDSVKSALGVGEEKSSSNPTAYRDKLSADEKTKEKLNYQSDPVYFQRRADFGKVSESTPGTKFNRAQIDALVYARNTGVSMGLLNQKDGDLFIANQMVEARPDFAVNPIVLDREGNPKANLIGGGEGASKEAAQSLFGMNPSSSTDEFVGGLVKVAPIKETGKGTQYLPMVSRPAVEKMFSPYTENMTPEKYQTNAKLALFAYLSKKNKGESPEKVVQDWNGSGKGSIEHMQKVKEAQQDLLHDNNSGLRQYISDRLHDDTSSYKIKGSSPEEESKYRKKNSIPDNAYHVPLGKDENINNIYKREASENGFVLRKFGEKTYAVPMDSGEVEKDYILESLIPLPMKTPKK